MVIDNIFRKKTREDTGSSASQPGTLEVGLLASPLDRLAAAIIDLSVILFPIIILLSSPIKRVLMSSVLTQNEMLFALSLGGMGLVALVTVIAYQTLFVYFLGGTIGKKIFHLKVVNIWDDGQVSLSDAFFRSVVWTLETGLLMIPHLSVFSDSRRRPLHDRLANTMVINPSKKSVLPPNIFEVTFAKSILTSVVAIALVVLVQQLILLGKTIGDNDYLASLIGEGVELCEEVDWALETWPVSEKSDNDSRVKVALALFAAGEASKECLKKEVAFFQVSNKEESPVAYLGQAFVYSSDSERSNQYLQRICKVEPYSPSCAMAKIVENWSDSAWEDVDLGFTSMGVSPPIHISVWAIRHYTKQRQFDKAAGFLDQLSPQKALSGFLALYRVKVLWGLHHRNDVRVIADTAMESLPQEDRLRISTWMCRREFYNDQCEAFSRGSCRVLARDVESSAHTLMDSDVALLTVLKSQCRNDHEEMRVLADTFLSREMKKYIDAMAHKNADSNKSVKLLTELVTEAENSPELQLQVKMELIQIEKKDTLLDDLKMWSTEAPSENWGVVGAAFMRRLNQERLFDQAHKIGLKMYSEGFKDDFVLKPMAVALFHLGSSEKAWNITSLLKKRNPSPEPITGRAIETRGPASASESSDYELVERALEKKFSNRSTQ